MRTQSSEIGRVHIVRLDPDEDVSKALNEAVQELDIKNGMILNGVGSLNRYRVHVVGTPTLPTEDVFFDGEGPFDMLSLGGLIIDGKVHAHMTLANPDKAIGGHVEDGCRVLTFVLVMIAETPGMNVTGWDTVG